MPALGLPLFSGVDFREVRASSSGKFTVRGLSPNLHNQCIKSALSHADIQEDMIISEEQVRLAVEYLQTSEGGHTAAIGLSASEAISSELMLKVQAVCAQLPETRDERVEHARDMVAGTHPSSSEVAEKMIGRIISDSLR